MFNTQNNFNQAPQNNLKLGINWVSGLAGAKGAYLPANTVADMLDSEGDILYIKSADNIGMSSLRIFRLYEITEDDLSKPVKADMSEYVTRQELTETLNKFRKEDKNEFVSANEQSTKSKSK